MNKRKIIILINISLILIAIFSLIIKKELILKNSNEVLFELAPIDPRSLMQGDYMELDYQITREFSKFTHPSRGYLVFTIDQNNVAQAIRTQKSKELLNDREYLIKYYSHKDNINFGAKSFFFQEGDADLYSKARYGSLKVSRNGEKVLYALYDENFKKIEQ